MALDMTLVVVPMHLATALENFSAAKWADTKFSNEFYREQGIESLKRAASILGFALTPIRPEATSAEYETADLTMGR